MFTAADSAAKRRVAVIGNGVPAKLDTTAEEIFGKDIYINNTSFKIVGIFEEKGSSGFQNKDEQIWIPLATAQFRVFGTKELDVISAQVAREDLSRTGDRGYRTHHAS